ncbi:MAG: ABC transporter ATP-binding protein [Chloroflexaceae bacterium]|nr:ABC transporter ATP-binding protein [Chloroflexaceae bacterium]
MGVVFSGLDAEDYDRSYSDGTLIRRIVTYFQPQARTMAVVSAMVALYSLSQAILPIVVAQGIDILASYRGTLSGAQYGLMVALAGVAVVLGALKWYFNYVRQSLSARAVGDVVLKLRQDAFTAVMKRDLLFYDRYASGKIVSRVTSDTQEFSTVVLLTMDLASHAVLLVIIVVALFFIEPALTLITLTIAPAFFVAALSFRRIARWTSRRAQRIVAQVNAAIQETITGISVAKGFRQEAAIYEDFSATNQLSYRVRLQQGLVFNVIFPVLDIVSGIGTAIVVYFGGLRVLGGTVSVGDWYLFVRSIMLFYVPLVHFASFWSQFQQGLAASERVFALVDAEPEVVQVASEPVTHLEGRVTLRDLHFGYREGLPVFTDFSLDIPAGQKVAMVGHTGAGKSSLARLLVRFYEFQGGELLIDGRDIRRLDLVSYHRQVGIVPQSPFLFTGTVADNIRYGRPGAGDAEVVRAAEAIGGGDWLRDLPRGIETSVGERGGHLSLGQRQLVALARVLLQDPSIFILDEATASIDPFTEAHIQEGLDVVMRGRTCMIIAHRLSTVRSADRIVVLRAGRIIEEGTHDALLARGGHYAELYRMYFRHQSWEYVEEVGQW